MRWLLGLTFGALLGATTLTAAAVLFTVPHAEVAPVPSAQLPGVILQVTPLDALPAYDTLEEAGVHAIERAYKCSRAYECGGAIAQRPDGRYVVGPVSSSYQGDSVEIHHSVPPGWKLAADYHTHPCLETSHLVPYLSPPDIEGALARRLPEFMGDTCTGDVHEFIPGRDSPNDIEVPGQGGLYLTKGRIVGHITVDGKSQEPDTGL